MLTLDETTIFFHYRRTAPALADHKLAGVIKNWAKLVRPATHSSKSASHATSIRSTSTTVQNTTTGTIGASSCITIGANENDDDEVLEQREPEDNTTGGFADEFELDNFEADAARSSPIKGGKRVTSDVGFSPHFTHMHQ
jgi:hypothetical protein